MTTPTVPEPPATTQPITCAIEFDPMAAPCGTGLEGWGGPLPWPEFVCINGETILAEDYGSLQQAIAWGSRGECPTAPEPVVEVPAEAPGLPVTGTEPVVMGGIAAALLAVGVLLAPVLRRAT